MKPIVILLLVFAGLGLLRCSPTPPPVEVEEVVLWEGPEQPNILWLVAEDLSPYIAAFGDSTVSTPNLDRLAREGVLYPQVYSPSGVCAPSRFAIATGMYPSHGGGHHMRTGPWYRPWTDEELAEMVFPSRPEGLTVYEAMPPAGVKLHSEYLREAGYYCTNNAKADYQFRAPVTAWDASNQEAHWRNRAPGQPFFAIFNFGITHESQIWARAADSLLVDEDLPVNVPPYLPDNDIGQRDVRQMYSNIVRMDQQIGEVLQELEQDGELENTIIFWYTDHGGPLPRQKRLLYDSGIHLPLIVRFPNQWRAGTVDDQLISFIDFKPTLLTLANIDIPEYVDGRAFLGTDATENQREYIHAAADRFDERYDMIRAVRDHRFKYLRNFSPEKGYYLPVAYREQMPVMQELLRLNQLDSLDEFQAQWFRTTKAPEELFDCVNDPHELRNLADDPQYQSQLLVLRAECDRWMKEIQDLGQIEEETMLSSWWPQGVQPSTQDPSISMEGQSFSISSATPGASIGYQWVSESDSLLPVWQVYQQPIPSRPEGKLAIIAHRIGYKASAVQLVDF